MQNWNQLRRFFIEPGNIRETAAHLTGDEARHLYQVDRLCSGELVVLFDGRGNEFMARIKETGAGKVALAIEQKRCVESVSGIKITVAQSMLKHDQMKLVIQNSSEMAASGIVPLLTRRSIARPDKDRGAKQQIKWQKVALASAKQCRRSELLTIEEPTNCKKLFAAAADYDLKIIFTPAPEAHSLKEVLVKYPNAKKILIAIGPEGGFDPDEIESAAAGGFQAAKLGPLTLRSASMAPAALSAIQYHYTG